MNDNDRVGMDVVWHWLGKVPVPALAVMFFTACMFFAGWVWNVEGEIGDARSSVAVNSEKIRNIEIVAADAKQQLHDMDNKLDQLLLLVGELKVEARKTRYARDYPGLVFPSPSPSPSPNNPLLNRENR